MATKKSSGVAHVVEAWVAVQDFTYSDSALVAYNEEAAVDDEGRRFDLGGHTMKQGQPVVGFTREVLAQLEDTDRVRRVRVRVA